MAPPNAVNAPLAAPPRVGLVASARPIDEPEREWIKGFRFEPEACSGAESYDPYCGISFTESVPANRDIRTFIPYMVRAYDRCSTIGWASRDWEGRAKRALLAQQSKQIEKEFWSGAIGRSRPSNPDGNNHFLASLDSDVLTDGPTSVTDQLSCLDGGLVDCNDGQRGMIHATRQNVILWHGENLLRFEGGLILTANDNIVVAGAGYNGSGPPGVPGGAPTPAVDGSVWAYATDIVDLRLSEISIFGAPNPTTSGTRSWAGANTSTNVITTRAERMAAATWNGCCHLAAEANISLCGTGGAGS